VVDEGHHAAAVTYQETLNYFPSARNLFVTATPLRADNVIMENVYQSVAFRYGIEKAIDNGWLVPIQQKVVKIDGLDFSKVRTLAEDFNQGDLEKILTEEKPLHGMCASAVDIIGNKQSLWFCVSVSHAKAMANVLSRYAGANQVCFLSGDTDKEERRAAVDAYKSGRIQHLVNCALFLEGFDAPHTSAIVMARPTKSLPLYVQVLGRGTRPLPGTVDGLDGADERRTAISISDKPNMLVIDFAGNAGRHKIIQAADIFGGKYDLPIREYAKQTNSQEGQTVDLEEQLERAKEELSLEREEEERLGKIKAKIKADSANYRTYDVDPFITRQYAGARDKAKRKFEPCTDKTAWKILYLSREAGGDWTFDKAKRLTQRQASGVIGSLQPQKVNHEY
jgi:superfamily II DNA or RNA helicase